MEKNYCCRFRLLLAALLIIAGLSSCTSAKKLTYLRDLDEGEFLKGSPKAAPVYKIKAKDNLYVSINSSDPEMNKLFNPADAVNQSSSGYEGQVSRTVNGNTVDLQGNINLPLIGNIPVEGKSIRESEAVIGEAAKKYLKEVTVKVKLLSYKITVLGEIKVPGVYYNYNDYITIFDAISIAQGTTDYAKLENVLILRSTPTGTRSFALNLNSKNCLSSEGYYLQPNDIVFLQPGKNKNLQQRLPLIGIGVGAASALLLLLNYLKK
jgi:polysaccharide export outer membrane protein